LEKSIYFYIDFSKYKNNMEQLIGRKEEIAVLKKALASTNAEMVSVIGRRRVGKTFLVNQIYKKHLVFSISGTQNTPLKEQLGNFAYLLNEYGTSLSKSQK